MPAPSAPKSVVSAAGTDTVEEDGARYDPSQYESNIGSYSQGASGPASPPPQSSRRGYTHLRSSRLFSGQSTPLSSSRPVSVSANRLSSSHAGVVAPAFLRPMSSQRLQAQRFSRSANSSRPQSSGTQADTVTGSQKEEEIRTLPNVPPSVPEQASRPASRRQSIGTTYTEQDPRDYQYYPAASDRNHTFTSTADSTRPLQRSRAPSVESLTARYKFASSAALRSKRNSTATTHSRFPGGRRMSRHDVEKYGQIDSPTTQPEQTGPLPNTHDKNWQHFTGNTVFCWGGRLQNTRDRPVSAGTALLVILPTILFFVFEAPYLWNHVSPAVPIFYAYFFFLCFSSFLHASFTDPGILPRNLHPRPKEKDDDPLKVVETPMDWTLIRSFASDSGAMDVPVKYCTVCDIWRPPRAHHCRVCDSCVDTQDHHCVWLNNCVGRRNYRYFFTFIGFGTILGIYLCFVSLGLCRQYASEYGISLNEAINQNRVAFAMFIYGFFIFMYPASLTGYHLFLMARGETTRELLTSRKFEKQNRHRPYDHESILRNWAVVLCRPRPPTYLRFKDVFIEGDQRFAPIGRGRQAPLSKEQQGGGMEMQSIGTTLTEPGRGSILPR